jgi:hypothetical protein
MYSHGDFPDIGSDNSVNLILDINNLKIEIRFFKFGKYIDTDILFSDMERI